MSKDVQPQALALHRAYKTAFCGPEGELVLRDLEARGFVNRSGFVEDPCRTAFNEGRRSLVLHIQHMLDEKNFNPNKENR